MGLVCWLILINSCEGTRYLDGEVVFVGEHLVEELENGVDEVVGFEPLENGVYVCEFLQFFLDPSLSFEVHELN